MNQNPSRIPPCAVWLSTVASLLPDNCRVMGFVVLLLSSYFSALAQGNYIIDTANNTCFGTYNTGQHNGGDQTTLICTHTDVIGCQIIGDD